MRRALHLPIPRRSCPIPARSAAGAPLAPVRHPLCSRLYAAQVERAEELGLRDRRRDLLAGLSGRVLEIGGGTGVNLRHYPPTVEELVVIEPEPYLRGLLVDAAAASSLDVRVVDATAERLPFDDASFDAAVCSLVLCSVRDVGAAARELCRVLKPGGELRFMEHVASPRPLRRRAQQLADATLWPHLSGGCHLGRDTLASVEAAGFRVDLRETFGFRNAPLDPPKTHVRGVATAV
jgi:ubiquinone/menaquinone biosynthesis C-methylase UbiE